MVSGDQKRVALVIGNGNYSHAGQLRNPAHDADAVAKTLREIGFPESRALTDVGIEDMRQRVKEFGRAADQADLAVIYYAGHGIEVDGENYLIPVDAKLDEARDVAFETVSLAQI